MNPFSVQTLLTEADVENLRFDAQARYIAGGTNLVDLMKHQIETPVSLVDLSEWEEASDIVKTGNGFRIGAMVTNSALANFAYQEPSLSMLSQALLSGATVQLRNRATTGGNLLQRTRCYYFYDTAKPCNKREPGTGCSAFTGMNRIHAIFGTSEQCIATHPSDMAVALIALNASVSVKTAEGKTRDVALREFYCMPGETPDREHVLKQGDLVTSVFIPAKTRGTQHYHKVRDRASYAFALVSVAAGLELSGETIRSVSLSFGGVGTIPWHPQKALDVLEGSDFSVSLLEKAIDAELADAKTFGSNDFKPGLLRRVFLSVMLSLAQRQKAQHGHEGALYENH
ncbi:FAD binding domain-containing protein [Alteromonas sp. H39]|uniref:FAD binding domain-containing protein n=1 Tax=Alteromonas sp. H39 TaxID=3389876 RepID=UPI0039E06B64